ncbi:tail fiber protein [Paenibacillus sp. ACRRX]|uniref:phage tail protein n=1 Tax=Paenibacillus sp. ACRRX TaxID=2918206 RepID=UPI001EF67C01|nr:tail fiber protein [Paenibacillus sp. ACRRX]MCG7408498.1 tail fiber protein [Paenibacillus sp. ACRRX]
MAEPYIGEIRMFSGSYAPQGWALCNGQLLSISENEVLFTLLGTTYGGDGQTNFALPDLRGRVPIHNTPTYPLGSRSGTETVTLTSAQLPVHSHGIVSTNDQAMQQSPENAVWAAPSSAIYGDQAPAGTMSPASILPTGGNHPHNNMMPYLTVNFIISLFGIYPSQG